MDEFAFLDHVRRRLVLPDGALGLSDDAAALDGWVVTTDMLVEEVHFRFDWSAPEDVGWKAAAVNLSDLAAMGSWPVGLVWAVGIPEGEEGRALRVLDGLAACAGRYHANLFGGDTVRAPVMTMAVTAFGRAETPVPRSGAGAGDLVGVTGPVGGAAGGLALLRGLDVSIEDDLARSLIARHQRPEPRLAAGTALARAGVTAMVDVSDGLGADLGHVARASGVRIEIERVPLADGVTEVAAGLGEGAERFAMRGGDDYELAFTIPADRADVLEQVGGILVGRVSEGEGVWRRDERVDDLGWRH